MPRVAVITRTKDRPKLLTRAIKSVLDQSFQDWIHCIVNDGGDRKALDSFLSQYKNEYNGRLKVIHQKNQGMQNAANNGIKETDSSFIVIHDDDDQWDPRFLETTVDFLESEGEDSNYQGVITQTEQIYEKLDTAQSEYREIERKPYIPLQEVTLFRLGFENPFPPIAFLYRRKVHDLIGMFNPRWDVVADMDFNYRFLQQFDIGVVQKQLAFYRWRKSTTEENDANSVTTGQQIHRKLLYELKNHYLRSADSNRELASALSLQLSQYLLEDEWMTAEIRDKTQEAFTELQKLNEQLELVRKYQNEGAWPKLEELSSLIQQQQDPIYESKEKLIELNERLQEALKNISDKARSQLNVQLGELESVNALLAEVKKFQIEDAWPKLDAINKFNHDDLWPKLDALNKFNHEDLWPKLDESSHTDHKVIIPKLDELIQNLNRIGSYVDEEVQKFTTLAQQLNSQVEEVRKFNNETSWPHFQAFKSHLERIEEKVTPKERSLLQIGRLRLEWKFKAKK